MGPFPLTIRTRILGSQGRLVKFLALGPMGPVLQMVLELSTRNPRHQNRKPQQPLHDLLTSNATPSAFMGLKLMWPQTMLLILEPSTLRPQWLHPTRQLNGVFYRVIRVTTS